METTDPDTFTAGDASPVAMLQAPITLEHIKQAAEWAKQQEGNDEANRLKGRTYAQDVWDCGTACCMWGGAHLIARGVPVNEGPPASWRKKYPLVAALLMSGRTKPDQLLALLAADLANLSSANLEGANLRGADLEGANLSSANLSSADLEGADLSSANLRGANLSSANLRGADLRGADLEGADLEGANLRGADLRGADLEGANLRGADLRGADLEGADLEGADLEGANLSSANLSSANLEGADLSSANLRGADLSSADLEGANGSPKGILLPTAACPWTLQNGVYVRHVHGATPVQSINAEEAPTDV